MAKVTLTIKDIIFVKEGTTKEGKPWKKYKLITAEGKEYQIFQNIVDSIPKDIKVIDAYIVQDEKWGDKIIKCYPKGLQRPTGQFQANNNVLVENIKAIKHDVISIYSEIASLRDRISSLEAEALRKEETPNF